MFRFTLVSLIFLFLVTSCGAPQDSPLDATSIETEVLTVLERQTAAWNEGDLETFVADYDEGTTFIGSGNLVRGREALLERYRVAYPDATRGQLAFTDLETEVLAANAVHMIGRYVLTNPDQPDATGRFTLLFAKRNGNWKIVHDHSSAAPPTDNGE